MTIQIPSLSASLSGTAVDKLASISKQTPEEVAKMYQATGPNSDLVGGNRLNEEQQTELWHFISYYGVMLAPYVDDVAQYPGDSPVARSYQQRNNKFNTSSSIGGVTALVPGNARKIVHTGGATSGTYDQAYHQGHIVRAATENTPANNPYTQNTMRFGQRRYETRKIQATLGWTMDFIVRNMQGQGLGEALSKSTSLALGQDFEYVAINGDAAAAPALDALGNETDVSMLTRVHDGWLKQIAAECPRFSAGGESVDETVFYRAVKSQPAGLGLQDLQWWAHPHMWLDWVNYMGRRGAGAVEAAAALVGQGVAPMGIQMTLVPTFPTDQALYMASAAVAARLTSYKNDKAFFFQPGAHQFVLTVDNLPGVIITFPNTDDPVRSNITVTADRAVLRINELFQLSLNPADPAHEPYLGKDVASIDAHGRIQLESPVFGAASRIIVAPLNPANPAGSALPTLGFRAETAAGQAAGNNNVVREGSPLLFAASDTFAWHVNTADPGANDKGLRFYTQFNQKADRFETDIYGHLGATIAEPSRCWSITQLRVVPPHGSMIAPTP